MQTYLGIIDSIDKDFMENILIKLKTNNQFQPSIMLMEQTEKDQVLKTNKGNKVAVSCNKISRQFGAPYGEGCIFTDPIKPLPNYN